MGGRRPSTALTATREQILARKRASFDTMIDFYDGCGVRVQRDEKRHAAIRATRAARGELRERQSCLAATEAVRATRTPRHVS